MNFKQLEIKEVEPIVFDKKKDDEFFEKILTNIQKAIKNPNAEDSIVKDSFEPESQHHSYEQDLTVRYEQFLIRSFEKNRKMRVYPLKLNAKVVRLGHKLEFLIDISMINFGVDGDHKEIIHYSKEVIKSFKELYKYRSERNHVKVSISVNPEDSAKEDFIQEMKNSLSTCGFVVYNAELYQGHLLLELS